MQIHYFRYRDLVEAGIIRNRTTLARWIRDQGFPKGVKLGPKTVAWSADEVAAWLETRRAQTSNT